MDPAMFEGPHCCLEIQSTAKCAIFEKKIFKRGLA